MSDWTMIVHKVTDNDVVTMGEVVVSQESFSAAKVALRGLLNDEQVSCDPDGTRYIAVSAVTGKLAAVATLKRTVELGII